MACVWRLVFWNRIPDPDPTLDTWPVIICTQIIRISSACFLYLKPFLDSVESGFVRSDNLRHRGSDYNSGSASARKHSSFDGVGLSKVDGTRMKPINKHSYAASIEGGLAANRDELKSESQHSRIKIIRETKTFAMETSQDVPEFSSSRSNDVCLT